MLTISRGINEGACYLPRMEAHVNERNLDDDTPLTPAADPTSNIDDDIVASLIGKTRR